MHLFKFYIDDKGWPLMHYKKRCTDKSWLPPENPRRMWREKNRLPHLSSGDPKPLPMKPLWSTDTINSTQKNMDKELSWALECSEQKNFNTFGFAQIN